MVNRKAQDENMLLNKVEQQRKLAFLFSCLFAFCLLLFAFMQVCLADQAYTLKGGVSLDKVPKELYGTWRVQASLISTNSSGRFKPNTTDLWNLSRAGSVLTLDNPFSGAHASITVNEVSGRLIKFEKSEKDGNQKLTDVVELNLGKDSFTGINKLKLDTLSSDGHVTKSESASYNLVGEKISGQSIK